MIRSFLIISLTCILSAITAQVIPNQIIIKSSTTNKKALLRSVFNLSTEINYVEIKTLSDHLGIEMLILDTPDNRNMSGLAIDYLLSQPDIEYAYPNQHTHNRATPNDPILSEQWGLDVIKATEAWNTTTGGQSISGDEIVIAVMDDGFDIEHIDIRNNLWVNQHEIPNDNIDNDNNGYVDDYLGLDLKLGTDELNAESHGTSVMGIIGAETNNGQGISGINWNSKILLMSSVTNEALVIEAFDYILTQRRRYNETNGAEGSYIVASNYSLGIDNEFGDDHPAWCNLYNALGEVGILSVGATTNSNFNVDVVGDLPTTCSSPYLITVTNTNIDDEKVTNAGYGSTFIDLGAPGRNTQSLKPFDQYGKFGGTSASAPHVTGALGLLFAMPCEQLDNYIKAEPADAALRIKKAILDGTDPLTTLDGLTVTGGRLNILNAMTELREYCGGDSTTVISGDLQIDQISNSASNLYTFYYKIPTSETVSFLVHDMSGKLIFKANDTPGLFSRSNVEVDLNGYPTGIYIASVILNGEIVSRKFHHLSY